MVARNAKPNVASKKAIASALSLIFITFLELFAINIDEHIYAFLVGVDKTAPHILILIMRAKFQPISFYFMPPL
jgi:hypothetical protein